MSKLKGMGGHLEYHPEAKPQKHFHRVNGKCTYNEKGVCNNKFYVNYGKKCKRPYRCLKYLQKGYMDTNDSSIN